MRGCVSAGATAALNILGIHDTIDVVYGRYHFYSHIDNVRIYDSSHLYFDSTIIATFINVVKRKDWR